jgi:hypothetical protein
VFAEDGLKLVYRIAPFTAMPRGTAREKLFEMHRRIAQTLQARHNRQLGKLGVCCGSGWGASVPARCVLTRSELAAVQRAGVFRCDRSQIVRGTLSTKPFKARRGERKEISRDTTGMVSEFQSPAVATAVYYV